MRRLVFLLPIAIVAVLVAIFWIGLDPKRDKSILPSALVGKPVQIWLDEGKLRIEELA